MAGTAATPAGAADDTPSAHEHPWPLSPAEWDELITCRTCGLLLLRGFIGISDWVVRRVEGIQFVDDRTVRRRVSVDYTVPREAVMLRVGEQRARVLPLALMRRKNMINFDFNDHDGRPMPLMGLRQNQALTLAVVRAWADATLEEEARENWPRLPRDLGELLDDIVAGDQAELTNAYLALEERKESSPHLIDDRLTALLERLAGNFVLFAIDPTEPGTRRIVKWSYDEPLTLLHSTSSYQGQADGPCPGRPLKHKRPEPVTYGKAGRRQGRWELDPSLAGLGLQPTLIRFPAPGAELAASFHLEITAPPEVSIVQASLLAGTPNLRFADEPKKDREEWEKWRSSGDAEDRARRARVRRRPSFDSVGGGYPTVDLHVADVPYGSLSRAQVELQASPTGWLASAWLAALLATVTLCVAWLADPGADATELPTLVLISYAAAMVAVVVRPDPHVMVTRLLMRLRTLAAASAVLTLAGAGAFAFLDPETAHPWLGAMALLSLVPTLALTVVWWLARRRLVRDRPPGEKAAARRRKRAQLDPLAREARGTSWYGARRRLRDARRTAPLVRLSPWEQHLPDHDLGSHVDTDFHVRLAKALDAADYPYDEAVVRLGFDRPGIKVASLEGDRSAFPWTIDFAARFQRRLDRELGRWREPPPDPAPDRAGQSG
jgi:hypothetical protein